MNPKLTLVLFVMFGLALVPAQRALAQADLRSAKCGDCNCNLVKVFDGYSCCCPKCFRHGVTYKNGSGCWRCRAEDDQRHRAAEGEAARRERERRKAQAEHERQIREQRAREEAHRQRQQAEFDQRMRAQQQQAELQQRAQQQNQSYWDNLQAQNEAFWANFGRPVQPNLPQQSPPAPTWGSGVMPVHPYAAPSPWRSAPQPREDDWWYQDELDRQAWSGSGAYQDGWWDDGWSASADGPGPWLGQGIGEAVAVGGSTFPGSGEPSFGGADAPRPFPIAAPPPTPEELEAARQAELERATEARRAEAEANGAAMGAMLGGMGWEPVLPLGDLLGGDSGDTDGVPSSSQAQRNANEMLDMLGVADASPVSGEVGRPTYDRSRTPSEWVASDAKSAEGSDRYAADRELDHFGITYPVGSNKCNIFVHDVLFSAGITPPTWVRPSLSNAELQVLPLLASHWADRGSDITKFTIAETPRVGDVVAAANSRYNGASGHVGIVVETETHPDGRVGVLVASVSSRTGKVVIKPLTETFPSADGYSLPVFRRAQ